MNKEQYHEYLQSEAWQIRRQWKLDQADYRCQLCNGTGELHVHHRTYERIGKERENDLTVLCKDCHARFHDKEPAAGSGIEAAFHRALDRLTVARLMVPEVSASLRRTVIIDYGYRVMPPGTSSNEQAPTAGDVVWCYHMILAPEMVYACTQSGWRAVLTRLLLAVSYELGEPSWSSYAVEIPGMNRDLTATPWTSALTRDEAFALIQPPVEEHA